jgi:hypothetical protein
MDVFLIPVGSGRYELYCEGDDDGDEDRSAEDTSSARGGFFRTRFMKFRERLRQAERERRYGAATAETRAWRGSMSDKALRWMAEKIAEQRLLWNLRGRTDASLFYPADLSEAEAIEILKSALKLDAQRHGGWALTDGILLVLTSVLLGPLFLLVPGVANIPAAYFAFRTVGHFLSWKGALQGLLRVRWRAVPSEPLSELRRAISLEPAQRERRVSDIASELRLERLAMFFERTVTPGA